MKYDKALLIRNFSLFKKFLSLLHKFLKLYKKLEFHFEKKKLDLKSVVIITLDQRLTLRYKWGIL